MNRLIFLKSSIGKKWLMAITGLGFIGFLAAHLAGNLTLFAGKDVFNAYADRLHDFDALLIFLEAGLIGFGLIHVGTGLLLYLQNLKARPKRYAVKKSAGGRSPGSATMPYTGVMIFGFVIYHLLTFSFVDKSRTPLFDVVSTAFHQPLTIAIHMAAALIAGLHISHGLWSAFQTLGVSHEILTPLIRGLSLAAAVAVGIGFGVLPLYMAVMG